MFILTLVGRLGHQKGGFGVVSKLSILRFLGGRVIVGGTANIFSDNLILILISVTFLMGGRIALKRGYLLL